MAEGKFYITTPIYYPSDKLHIGHAYTTTVADSLARWHRFLGEDVFFLTGSDEHGQKIQRISQEKGMTPNEYVDNIVASFKELWAALNVQFDDFVRTTEDRHHRAVQAVFQHLYDNGDIYKSKYEGWYCTPCETFWVEKKLEEGCCPDCHRPVELVEEESYFFKMGKYSERLLKHIESHPEFIQPETRRNEMVNFIKGGLDDLCVTRTTFDWGVPVPFDDKHVIYVWVDAVTNYITAIGYPEDKDRLAHWWPADVHLVGKEIMRFHTIIWPILLMAIGLPLPKVVFGHGWLLFDSDKMSKSKGNVVDPHQLISEFGVDPIRYFLMREISFGQDGNFNRQALIGRTNSDLANDLGNLLNRSLAMLQKYFDGVVPQPLDEESLDRDLKRVAEAVPEEVAKCLESLDINQALTAIWSLIGRANKYVDESAPWALAKDSANQGRLQTVMYNLIEVQRVAALLVKSFLPETGEKIWSQLGVEEAINEQGFADTGWGGLKPGVMTKKGDPIFPRIDLDEEPSVEVPKRAKAQPAQSSAGKAAGETENVIGIEDFSKVELVVAEVLEAGRVQGADRLLKLQVDIGGETRQIVAGIANHYDPDELLGRRIIVVRNLKPAKLRGEVSEGMLLAASSSDGNCLELLTVSDALAPGSRVR